MKIITLLLALFSMTSCSKKEPVFDGSSSASAKASVERLSKNLDPEKKEQFQSAYIKLGFQSLRLKSGHSTKDAAEDFIKTMDGKTAAEIIEMAGLKNERLPKYVAVNGSPGMGRLGISKQEAVDLWGDYTESDIVAPAGQGLIFKPKGFIIGVQIWKGKVAQIQVSKGRGMPKFDKEELLQLCGKMTGSGKWKPEGFKKERKDGRVFMLNFPSLPRFRTADFEAAVNKAEKETKVKAIEEL